MFARMFHLWHNFFDLISFTQCLLYTSGTFCPLWGGCRNDTAWMMSILRPNDCLHCSIQCWYACVRNVSFNNRTDIWNYPCLPLEMSLESLLPLKSLRQYPTDSSGSQTFSERNISNRLLCKHLQWTCYLYLSKWILSKNRQRQKS